MRISANSRARWATVMDIVLKMMKAPTNSAMPPKATSAALQDLQEVLEAADVEAVLLLGGLDLGAARQRRGDRLRQLVGIGPRLAVDQDRVDLALLLEQALRGAQREDRRAVALPIDLTSPNRAIPVMRYWRTGPRALTPIVSPSR